MEETRFDEIGNIEWKEVTQKEPDGAVIRSTYDSDGKLLERETSNKDESIIENFEYGSKSKKRRYSNGLSKIQDELFFDEKSKTWVLNERVSRSESLGKITETKVAFREGKEWIRIIRVIDSKTNLETEYIQSPKGLIKNSDLEFMKNYHFYYEYKFDSHQNWLEKKEMQKVSKFGRISFEPFRILKREIAYYE
jgi:YD repeat-containing protein